MVYAAEEYGEKGMDKEGFSGKDGRTTIFDYWSIDTLCRANKVLPTGVTGSGATLALQEGLGEAEKHVSIKGDQAVEMIIPAYDRFLKTKGRHEYRAFISHKKCIILYWFDNKTLSVTDVLFTDTHSPRIF